MNNLKIPQGGLADLKEAKEIARLLFESYDANKSGAIEPIEVSGMLQDAYKTINRQIQPTKLDVDSYSQLLDRNCDGRVTLQDLEAVCIKYLVGSVEK